MLAPFGGALGETRSLLAPRKTPLAVARRLYAKGSPVDSDSCFESLAAV